MEYQYNTWRKAEYFDVVYFFLFFNASQFRQVFLTNMYIYVNTYFILFFVLNLHEYT